MSTAIEFDSMLSCSTSVLIAIASDSLLLSFEFVSVAEKRYNNRASVVFQNTVIRLLSETTESKQIFRPLGQRYYINTMKV